MSISDYTPPTATVEFKGGSFDVRGLALDDVAQLVRNHLPDLDAMISLFQSTTNPDQAAAEMMHHAVKLMQEAPGLAANMIALAGDQPDEVDNVRRMPMPVQLRAIEAIGRLTFEEAGGPKNFFASLKNLFQRVKPALAQTGSPT